MHYKLKVMMMIIISEGETVMCTNWPMDIDADCIFKRKAEIDGVVMEIVLPLIVITEEKTDLIH